MSNKFIKISAPPESAAEAEARRQQELEAKKQLKKDQAAQAEARLREKQQQFGGKDLLKI